MFVKIINKKYSHHLKKPEWLIQSNLFFQIKNIYLVVQQNEKVLEENKSSSKRRLTFLICSKAHKNHCKSPKRGRLDKLSNKGGGG